MLIYRKFLGELILKQKKMIIFLSSIILILSSNLGASSTDRYTMEQIYNNMCIECHSSNGSGNTEKLTPSMANLSLNEIKESLLEIENEDGHVIMQHNRDQILKKDMKYSAKEMATYLHTRFNR